MDPVDPQGWSEVDDFLAEQLIGDADRLDWVLAHNHSNGLPSIDVSAVQGKMLMLLARMARAKRILEIGTLGGFSTIWLARALPPEGRLVTLELKSHHAAVAQDNIAKAGLADFVDVRQGNANDSLNAMIEGKKESFDLVFVDADKGGYADYFEKVMQLAEPGATLIFDNVVRHGAVIEDAPKDKSGLGARGLVEAIAADERVTATAVQTVGSKGWDGFLIAHLV